MRSLGLVLALCGAAALIGASGVASAFETQGSGDPIDGQSLLAQPQSLAQDLKAHSLAMPLAGKSDSGELCVELWKLDPQFLGPESICRRLLGPSLQAASAYASRTAFPESAPSSRRRPSRLARDQLSSHSEKLRFKNMSPGFIRSFMTHRLAVSGTGCGPALGEAPSPL